VKRPPVPAPAAAAPTRPDSTETLNPAPPQPVNPKTASRQDRPAAAPRPVIPRARPADNLETGTVGRERPQPALLKDPLPRVTAILVANDRRFATVEQGQVVGVGDVVGRRTVVRIDERAVVLREPSGVQIRVGLGGRLLGVERGP
jgi:hypothetical protein